MQHFRNYILLFLIIPFMALAEDGSQLWLRYPVNPKSRNIVNSNSKSPTIEIAKKELNQHWSGQAVDLKIDKFPENFKDGYRIVSTPKKNQHSCKNRFRITVRKLSSFKFAAAKN